MKKWTINEGDWCVADTETLKEFHDPTRFNYSQDVINYVSSPNYKGRRVWLISFYNDASSVVFDVYNDQASIIKLLLKWKLIYFHNLSYDGNFIIKLLQKFGWCERGQLVSTKGVYSYEAMVLGSKIYRVILFYGNKKVTTILDSFNFLRCKVDKIPTQFGLEGLKKTWKGRGYDEAWMYEKAINNVPSADYDLFLDYCKNDAKIVYYAMKKLFYFCELLNQEFKLYNYTTISSFAYDVYCAFNPFIKDYLQLDFNNFANTQEYLALRSVYKGGFCDVNNDYMQIPYLNKNINSYDINSAYPAILQNSVLPCSFKPDPNLQYVTKIICFVALTPIKANSNLRFIFNDALKYKLDDYNHPATFNTGSIFYLYEEEFNYFKKYYDGKIKIIKEFNLYGTKFDNGGYVKYFYKLKKDYKQEHNAGFLTISKLFLNAVTGKFGQRPTFKNRVCFCNEEEVKMKKFDNDLKIMVKKQYHLHPSNDETFYIKKQYFDENDLDIGHSINNFLLISYITMKTRILIYSFIEKVGIKNWLYSDTDSLKIFGTLDDPTLIGLELGQFKNEGTAQACEFYHPKAYYWNGKFTFGGLDTTLANETVNYLDVKVGYVIKEGKKLPKNVTDGIELISTDYIVGE